MVIDPLYSEKNFQDTSVIYGYIEQCIVRYLLQLTMNLAVVSPLKYLDTENHLYKARAESFEKIVIDHIMRRVPHIDENFGSWIVYAKYYLTAKALEHSSLGKEGSYAEGKTIKAHLFIREIFALYNNVKGENSLKRMSEAFVTKANKLFNNDLLVELIVDEYLSAIKYFSKPDYLAQHIIGRLFYAMSGKITGTILLESWPPVSVLASPDHTDKIVWEIPLNENTFFCKLKEATFSYKRIFSYDKLINLDKLSIENKKEALTIGITEFLDCDNWLNSSLVFKKAHGLDYGIYSGNLGLSWMRYNGSKRLITSLLREGIVLESIEAILGVDYPKIIQCTSDLALFIRSLPDSRRFSGLESLKRHAVPLDQIIKEESTVGYGVVAELRNIYALLTEDERSFFQVTWPQAITAANKYLLKQYILAERNDSIDLNKALLGDLMIMHFNRLAEANLTKRNSNFWKAPYQCLSMPSKEKWWNFLDYYTSINEKVSDSEKFEQMLKNFSALSHEDNIERLTEAVFWQLLLAFVQDDVDKETIVECFSILAPEKLVAELMTEVYELLKKNLLSSDELESPSFQARWGIIFAKHKEGIAETFKENVKQTINTLNNQFPSMRKRRDTHELRRKGSSQAYLGFYQYDAEQATLIASCLYQQLEEFIDYTDIPWNDVKSLQNNLVNSLQLGCKLAEIRAILAPFLEKYSVSSALTVEEDVLLDKRLLTTLKSINKSGLLTTSFFSARTSYCPQPNYLESGQASLLGNQIAFRGQLLR